MGDSVLCSNCGVQPVWANGRCNRCRVYFKKYGKERSTHLVQRALDRDIEKELEEQNYLAPRAIQSVYRYYDDQDRLLYVGVTSRGSRRSTEHSSRAWWHLVARATFEHYPNRDMALTAEAKAIRDEAPMYNRDTGRFLWCENCDARPADRSGRCPACLSYWKRTGQERPQSLAVKQERRRDERRWAS